MFTKQEVRKMKKGFHPSRTGKSETAMVGKGEKNGSRAERRADLSIKGQINFNGWSKMQVIGTSRFIHFVQGIPLFDKKTGVCNGVKKVSHSILVSKPNN